MEGPLLAGRVIQSTLALRTPRNNGHPNNTEDSYIPGKNKLQAFD